MNYTYLTQPNIEHLLQVCACVGQDGCLGEGWGDVAALRPLL